MFKRLILSVPLQRHREHPRLPRGVEPLVLGLGDDRAEAHHAAEVGHPVHGAIASPAPIIESLVTSAASASSSRSSVPGGRIGTTR